MNIKKEPADLAKDIFGPALETLGSRSFAFYGPESFQDYLKKYDLTAGTAESISIDSYERLPKILKDNHAMVLRLGESSVGTGTQFCLIKAEGRLDDFFLNDSECFTEATGSTYLPNASFRELFSFQLLNTFTESSLLNLAMASGILSYALGLDERKGLKAPAAGCTTFTFQIRPYSELDVKLEHRNGQVDIDALFVEARNGKDCLFVIEAKSSETDRSLAKHKLVYPILALASRVPKDIPIIPIYMKAYERPDGIHFHVLECELPDPRIRLPAINELLARAHRHLIFPTQGRA